jgi:hypothetical protein
LFVKKNYHDRHTSSEKFTHETETELTEEQMSTHVEKINPDFWGAGFWPGETIESESQILQLIR